MKAPTESATVRAGASPPAPRENFSPPWHGELTATARRFYQICLAAVSEAIAEGNLTSLQFAALLYISKQPGRGGLEQNRLAAGLAVDRNSASLLVEQLVTKGLIERRVNGADRRARLLTLTAKGEKLRQHLRPPQLAANERILASLKPHERKALFDLLNRVIEANQVGPTADGKRASKFSSQIKP
jgi:DNA-binding MarR family transcriptional regulator